jgi:hypothetical protein
MYGLSDIADDAPSGQDANMSLSDAWNSLGTVTHMAIYVGLFLWVAGHTARLWVPKKYQKGRE